jgi:hypothetical protein
MVVYLTRQHAWLAFGIDGSVYYITEADARRIA